MALHNVEPIEQTPSLALQLWHYQRAGVAKILHCWQGPYESCILGDEMGLGKTIQAITASMLDPDTTPAMFSLIVTTKTCVMAIMTSSYAVMALFKPSTVGC